MGNIIKIKHGQGEPSKEQLQPYELGYDENNKKIYIGVSEAEPVLLNKDEVEYANYAGEASSADHSEHSTYAERAGEATNATNATNAEDAVRSEWAIYATEALTAHDAQSAEFATEALRATKADSLSQQNVGNSSTPVYLLEGQLYPCEGIISTPYYGFTLPNDDDGKPDLTIYYYIANT